MKESWRPPAYRGEGSVVEWTQAGEELSVGFDGRGRYGMKPEERQGADLRTDVGDGRSDTRRLMNRPRFLRAAFPFAYESQGVQVPGEVGA
ncbi:hypothetical protein Sm713_69000 [Streptomyces sp. TS71-3]|nr:hypothetical protein Sm713_69000 [Streptomyces sp. TS71-3]